MRSGSVLSALLLSAAMALPACVHRDSFVHVDAALGRVVVYRNGVAFYERRAHVAGGRLTIAVPRDKVDDFLKSLTVKDASSGQPVPVSFPRQQRGDGALIEMVLAIPSKAPTDLILTYVAESPSWKPSYRVSVKADGKVSMEGWAIVDNTSGEDWRNVIIGVGSSSALSFHYDLWSVRSVERATLHGDDRFAVAPPTAVSPYGGNPPDDGAVVAELDDSEIRRPPGHPDDDRAKASAPPHAAPEASLGEEELGKNEKRAGGKQTRGLATPSREPARPVAEGDSKLHAIVPQAMRSGATIVIESTADGNLKGAELRAGDRANIVRNQLIDEGMPPAQIQIETKVSPGGGDHVRLLARAAAAPGATDKDKGKGGDPRALADAAPVGESHFESKTPMTVPQGTSVMVSVVRADTDGAEVYLYDPESERGNDRFAFKSIRLKNPTDSTLETGPVTVYGQDRFIGEGLTEPIPPHATVVIPYALDRQIAVETSSDTDDRLSRLITLERGVLTAEVQHIKRHKIVLTSRLRTPSKVYIRHTVTKGWTLTESPKVFERIGDAHLFEIQLAAGETKTVEIDEATPLTRTLEVGSEVCLDMLRLYVDSPAAEGPLKASLDKLLAIHRELVDDQEKVDALHQQLEEYRARLDELHDQIFSLKLVKTGGQLMAHLRSKMIEISDRVQKTTIALVDLQEKVMLARVRFQDGLAELHLAQDEDPKPAAATD
jgi:hypothetical protein